VPLCICIGGPTGAGKSVLAFHLRREVLALNNAVVLDNDQVRREIRGHDLRAVMQDEDYAPDVTAQVRARMDVLTRDALAHGRAVIDTSGFWSEEAREQAQDLAKDCGTTFVGFWLLVDSIVLMARIQNRLDERKALPVLSCERGHASDACHGVLRKYASQMPSSTPSGWYGIDANGPENDVLNRAISLI